MLRHFQPPELVLLVLVHTFPSPLGQRTTPLPTAAATQQTPKRVVYECTGLCRNSPLPLPTAASRLLPRTLWAQVEDDKPNKWYAAISSVTSCTPDHTPPPPRLYDYLRASKYIGSRTPQRTPDRQLFPPIRGIVRCSSCRHAPPQLSLKRHQQRRNHCCCCLSRFWLENGRRYYYDGSFCHHY